MSGQQGILLGQYGTFGGPGVMGAGDNSPNDQNDPAAAIPVYFVSSGGSAPYSNDQGSADGAVPVYVVASGSPPPWPTDQGKAAGAIPVTVVSGGSVAPYPNNRNPNGAIPVYDAGSAGTPTSGGYPNDQGNKAGAIPVWVVS